MEGLKTRIAILKPFLTEAHRKKRLRWAQERRDWTPMQRRNYLFADESKFRLCLVDRTRRVWRRHDEPRHEPL